MDQLKSKLMCIFISAFGMMVMLRCSSSEVTDLITNSIPVFNGKVIGRETSSAGIRVFKGIPYAQPPVDELRWAAPLPVIRSDSVLDCTKFGNNCMQGVPEPELPYTC